MRLYVECLVIGAGVRSWPSIGFFGRLENAIIEANLVAQMCPGSSEEEQELSKLLAVGSSPTRGTN